MKFVTALAKNSVFNNAVRRQARTFTSQVGAASADHNPTSSTSDRYADPSLAHYLERELFSLQDKVASLAKQVDDTGKLSAEGLKLMDELSPKQPAAMIYHNFGL